MSDLVERLRAANTWLNEGDCCGQLDASGTCMAPACIFGEALRMANEAAARIEQLEAEAKTRTLDYLGQVGQLSEEVTRLRAALEVCDRVLHFDLRGMITWGKDYNQAVKDAADAARAALEEKSDE